MGFRMENVTVTDGITTTALFVPTPPPLGNVQYTGTANQARVFFSPPQGNSTIPALTSHTAISTPGNISATIAQGSAGNVVVTGLVQGTTYTFRVYATNILGNGQLSTGNTLPFVAGNVPATPSTPTISAGPNVTSVVINFTAAANNGIPITSHTAQSNVGNLFGTVYQGSSGSITVNGLDPSIQTSFTVFATNAAGNGPNSAASQGYSASVGAQSEYNSAGTYTWVAPAGVSSVSVVAVGAGGNGATGQQCPGGGGGGLGWGNVAVTAGNSYTVVVGSPGGGGTTGPSYFNSSATVQGNGGTSGVNFGAAGVGGGRVGQGGGNGGGGGSVPVFYTGGGGGAGGYSGNGGHGGSGFQQGGNAGTGGGGGGAGGQGPQGSTAGGGGVGIYGEGPSGAAGGWRTPGSGGSGGQTGGNEGQHFGGAYGGGGGGMYGGSISSGGAGAVRIVWGSGRHYPSTNTANVFPDAPSTPTIGSVTLNGNDISVSYTANSSPLPITSHTAISTPGNLLATVNQANSGSITYSDSVYKFAVGTAYTFRVYALNPSGVSPLSSASASFTWAYNGQQTQYVVPGTYTWVAPSGVSSVSVVAIGAGGSSTTGAGGGGGGLGIANVSVTANSSYTVVVGASVANATAGQSYFSANNVVAGNGGGHAGGAGGTFVGNGGGNGGVGGGGTAGGGGGAGGYTGSGGNGGNAAPGANGAGGGGGGGGSGDTAGGGGGGGTGIYGSGPNGNGGAGASPGVGGTGGNGGSSGTGGTAGTATPNSLGGNGGLYGGGAGGSYTNSPNVPSGTSVLGANGAVRVMWGAGRTYPSTSTANVNYVAGNIPGTPTSAYATYQGGSIGVTYVAGSAGSFPITSHGAISTPGNLIASINQASNGTIQYGNVFAAGVSYTFNVHSFNAAGRSPAVTTTAVTQLSQSNYQVEYRAPGTYTWVAPSGVTSVSVVAVGGGGSGRRSAGNGSYGGEGGGGGGLGYANVSVTPSSSYTVVVGLGGHLANGTQSYFSSNTIVAGNGGQGFGSNSSAPPGSGPGGSGGGYVGTGGGFGGRGGNNSTGGTQVGPAGGGGGGGAAGYFGNGGNGVPSGGLAFGGNAQPLSGGGGGGRGGGGGTSPWNATQGGGGGGGGVGIYGYTGEDGIGGGSAFPENFTSYQTAGFGGSAGNPGAPGGNNGSQGGSGGNVGGGGGGCSHLNGSLDSSGNGGNGAVRIIWASPTVATRYYPSTNTANVSI